MRTEYLVVSFKMPKPIFKLRHKFLGRLAAYFYKPRYIDVISTISRVVERVSIPGTASGRLLSSAPLHVRSVRNDYLMRQRHWTGF